MCAYTANDAQLLYCFYSGSMETLENAMDRITIMMIVCMQQGK